MVLTLIRSIFTSVPVTVLVAALALSLGQIPRTSPEKLWGQVIRERAKLIEVFDSDVEERRARPKDWDGRIAVLKKKTATTLASYNVSDWKDEQLIFLSWLYDFVEKPSEKALCLEEFLSKSTRAPQKAEALAVLVQTYVDTRPDRRCGQGSREITGLPDSSVIHDRHACFCSSSDSLCRARQGQFRLGSQDRRGRV